MGCKISIITITFNSEETLEETIKSVINQDYDNFEYIIIDGGSKDNTLSIVEKYRSRIDYLVSESDKGICDAFNKGIAAATGEIVGIINSDDMLYPGALTHVAAVYQESEADIIYGNGKRMFEDGHMEDYIPRKLSFMKYGMPLVHPSTFVTKAAYDKYGKFDLRYKGCMDRELILRMNSMGAKFHYIEEYLSIYRMGGFSDENYLKVVAKERDELSIKYGTPKILVKLFGEFTSFKIKVKGLIMKKVE